MADTRYPVLLYDSHCNLCAASVRFLLKHDKNATIRFAALRSDFAQDFLRKEDLKRKGVESLILVKEDGYVMKSDAVLEAFRMLRSPWSWLYRFHVLPKNFRDDLYDMVARYRYNIFGKKKESMDKMTGYEERFLG